MMWNSFSVTGTGLPAATTACASLTFSVFSAPKTATAPSMAMNSRKLIAMKIFSPPLPGKSGFQRGPTNDDRSAKVTKIAATTPSPIACPVVSPASSTGVFHQIGQPSERVRQRADVARRAAAAPGSAPTPDRRGARTG